MGKKRPSNENIHIGEIYEWTSRAECGSSCGFCQVVGLRGKTLVELRAIRGERFMDESCAQGVQMTVKVRPLPGQFFEDSEPFTLRAGEFSELLGRKCLYGSDRGYYEMREGDVGCLTGYDAVYAMDDMEKEGTLPLWARRGKRDQ